MDARTWLRDKQNYVRTVNDGTSGIVQKRGLPPCVYAVRCILLPCSPDVLPWNSLPQFRTELQRVPSSGIPCLECSPVSPRLHATIRTKPALETFSNHFVNPLPALLLCSERRCRRCRHDPASYCRNSISVAASTSFLSARGRVCDSTKTATRGEDVWCASLIASRKKVRAPPRHFMHLRQCLMGLRRLTQHWDTVLAQVLR